MSRIRTQSNVTRLEERRTINHHGLPSDFNECDCFAMDVFEYHRVRSAEHLFWHLQVQSQMHQSYGVADIFENHH